MLSTYRSRKSKHEDTQKLDQHETYKISVEVAAPAAGRLWGVVSSLLCRVPSFISLNRSAVCPR